MKRLVAALAAVVTLSVVAVPVPAAAQRASARLSLASQTGWMRTDSFTMRLDVDRVQRPQELDVVVTVHRAVTSRSQFARTIEGELLGARVHRDEVPFQDLPFDRGGAIPITLVLPDLRPGVYPVAVALVDGDDTVASLVTHIVRVPAEPASLPLSVAWVQSYGVEPALGVDGTIRLDDDELDELRTIAAQLDDSSPLTIVPVPETIAALETLDDGRTVAALARLLERHQVLSSPFVDLDLRAMVGARRTDDFLRQRAAGDETLTAALGTDVDTRTASLTGELTAETLNVLTATGVRRLVIDETALRPLPSSVTGGVTLTRPFVVEDGEGRALDAVAADPGLAEHFTASDDVLGAHHLLADLAVLQRDLPGVQRGVVVRPPPGWSPSEPFLSTALANLGASPLLEPVTIEDLFAGVEPIVDDGEPVVRTFADVEPARFGPSGASLDRARAAIDGFASLAGGENPEVDLLDRLVLVGAHRALSRSRANAYVDAAIERVRTASANVQVLGDRTYRLTAREGTIPLTLLNANAFDVSVTVSLSSDKLEFARDAVDRIDIEANGTTTQAVPVKALTSGTFGLGVVVRSPDGRLELARSRFTITSTVASGVGIVLSAGAAAFLLLWWGSHWRTVRRARRLVPPEQPLDQPE